LAEKLLATFGRELEGVRLVPSSGGVFDMTADGEMIHSKKMTGSFPEPNDILDTIRTKMERDPS